MPILMYHRIAEAEDGPASLRRWRVARSEFERQLAWLAAEGYTSIRLDEWFEVQAHNPAALARRIVLTFDDAYRDFVTDALPVLADHGFGATMFVPTGFIGGAADWDRAFGTPAPLMSWEELDTIAAAGIEIGAHTISHPRLSGLTDTAAIAHEIAYSRRVLQQRYGQPIATFAYPYGDYDARVTKATEEAGFMLAVTVEPQSAGPFALGRLGVYGDEPFAAFVDRVSQSPSR
jgi:peptidoglycan/xylan/chitin deacetylase (PgdA/CDA1 family)